MLYFKYIYVSKRKRGVLPKECFKRPNGHTACNMSAFRQWERKASYIGNKDIRNNLHNYIQDWFSNGCIQGTLFAYQCRSANNRRWKAEKIKWPYIPQTSEDLIHSRNKISPWRSSHLMGHYLPCVILGLIMFSTSQLSWWHAVTASSRG